MKNLLGACPIDEKLIPLYDCLRLIKKTGFETTMFDWHTPDEAKETVEFCRKIGLEVDNFHAPFGGLNVMWYEGEAGENYTKRIEEYVTTAGRLNIPIVVVHCTAGGIPEEPHGSPIGIERFARIIELGKRCGVKIAFENLEYPEMLGLIMDVFKNEDIGFCYDTGHEALCTPGMRFIPLYGDRLCCTHIHDNYGASYSKVPIVHGDCHMLPFDGCLDFGRIMSDIRSTGYTGALTLESGIRQSLGYHYDLSPEAYFKRGFDALVKLSEM